MKKAKTRTLTGVALFTAIVVVLQLLGSFIRFGTFSVSLVLVPIVVGSAVYGTAAGAWLGLAFGLTVLASGDANLFLPISPIGTVLTVLLKGALAGYLAGLCFRLLEKKNAYAAVMVSALVCPMVNTGIFLLGCRIFFMEAVSGWSAAAGFENVGLYMIVGFVGLNFIFELLINLVLGPVILRLIKIGRKTAV